jgi:5-methylcytosine-specific restriction endonuclease McrA
MFRSAFKTSKPRRDSDRDIKQELTKLCSLITRLRMPYCCLCAENNWNVLEAAHFWHRDMPPTEFDLTNLSTCCRVCNQRHEYDPQPYRDYMLLTLGERGYADLADKAHAQTKVGYVELLELREQMRLTLEEEKAKAA